MRFLARAVVFLLATSVWAQNGTREPRFVGAYEPDGRFREPCKRGTCAKYGPPPRSTVDVPRSLDRDPRETVIEDIAPPARATKVLQRRNAFAATRDRVIAFVYGHEPVLRSPTHVVTDSRGRLIVSDPARASVQVLDGQGSFRIAGGPGRRLQRPNGVAVDAEDNIYVADGKLGMLLVYSPEGRFLRYLGRFHGESMFAGPAGIAIHQASGRLYVLDSPADELVVLDLQGKVLQRVGGRRTPVGSVRFDEPTELAMNHGSLAVLDSSGSRIQVLDLDGDLLHSFKVRNLAGPPRSTEFALAMDGKGNVYVSHVGTAALRIYRPDGTSIGELTQLPGARKRMGLPSGAWIDAREHIYLTEQAAGSIYVFGPAVEDRTNRPGRPSGSR